MLQSDSTQTIDHIQKCFRQQFQFSRRPSSWTTLFFLSVEALKLRQGQLHILKWNCVDILVCKKYRNAQDLYADRYPDRQQKSHMAFKRLATGSVASIR